MATALKEAERSKKEHSDETLFARVKTKLDLAKSNMPDANCDSAIRNGLLYFQVRKTVKDDETEDDAITAKRHMENTRRMMLANANSVSARRAQTAPDSPSRGKGPAMGVVTGFNPDANVTDGMSRLLSPTEAPRMQDRQQSVRTSAATSIFQHKSIHHDGTRLDEYDSDASDPVCESDDDMELRIERNAQKRLARRDAARIRRAMGSKYVGYDYPEIMGRDGLSAFSGSEIRLGGEASTYGGGASQARPHTSGAMGSPARHSTTSAGGLKSRQRMNASMGGSIAADDATFDQTYGGSTFTGSHTSATVVVDIDVDNASPRGKRRYAQDVLLLAQLKAGVLPEQLIMGSGNKKADNITIDVSHYGLGDEHGKCLGQCLVKLDTVSKLVLKDNRLTSSSILVLLSNVASSLVHLDLSHNDLHGLAAIAISQYFDRGSALTHLNLSECNLSDDDIYPICNTLSHAMNALENLNMSHNRLTHRGMAHIVDFLVSKTAHSGFNCHLKSLDVSWNEVGLHGATLLATAINSRGSGFGIEKIDISSNAITDEGGQRIGAAVMKNTKLNELVLCQNGLTGRTCFVWARVSSAVILPHTAFLYHITLTIAVA